MEPLNEGLKKFGKMKLYKRVDPSNSHMYKSGRGMNRKHLRQVPISKQTGTKAPDIQSNLVNFIKGLTLSNKSVDIAKKASSGMWRVSKSQVVDIAKKYKFNVPNEQKPMKHLGSTGIMMIRYKPGMYYMYKPHKPIRKRRIKAGVNIRKTYGLR